VRYHSATLESRDARGSEKPNQYQRARTTHSPSPSVVGWYRYRLSPSKATEPGPGSLTLVVVVVPIECWMDISNAARASSKKISRQRVSHTQKYLARHAPQPPIESLMSLLLKTPVDERLSLTHRQTRLTANTSALDHSHVAATASVSLACCPRSSNTIPSQSTSRALLLLRRRVSI